MPTNEEQSSGSKPDDRLGIGSPQPIGIDQNASITAHPTIFVECGEIYSLLLRIHEAFASVVSWRVQSFRVPSTTDEASNANFAAQGSEVVTFAAPSTQVVSADPKGQGHLLNLTAPAEEGHHITSVIGLNTQNQPVVSTSVPLRTTSPKTTL